MRVLENPQLMPEMGDFLPARIPTHQLPAGAVCRILSFAAPRSSHKLNMRRGRRKRAGDSGIRTDGTLDRAFPPCRGQLTPNCCLQGTPVVWTN